MTPNIIFLKGIRKIKRLLKKIYRLVKKINRLEKKHYHINPNFVSLIESKNIRESLKVDLNFNEEIQSANKILNNEYRIFSKNIYLENLDWTRDPITKYKWNNKYYTDIQIIDNSKNIDIKYIWEINRFQHLFTLSKAYALTNNEKYAHKFVKDFNLWIEQNPFQYSVNWTCSMEVAIRAMNFILVSSIFKESPIITEEFWNNFDKVLYKHGIHIYDNLEYDELKKDAKNNHFISNLAGLLFIGIYFSNSESFYIDNNPRIWLEFSMRKLEDEMMEQVYSDGGSYEDSTAYHRLVTEIFMYSTIIAHKNGIKFSNQYMNRLKKMCDLIYDLSDNYYSPLIGDNDNGRIFLLDEYFTWKNEDFTNNLPLAATLFNESKYIYKSLKHIKESYYFFGKVKEVEKKSNLELESQKYGESGYYILRNEIATSIINCGDISCRGQGSHSHNDQLSYTLTIKGIPFIIDPGVYVYTSDINLKKEYRKTSNHNVLCIGDLEVNEFIEDDIWCLKHNSKSRLLHFSNTEFRGIHYGYQNKFDVTVKRIIKLENNYLYIKDLLSKSIDNYFYSTIILDPDIRIKIVEDGIECENKHVKMKIICKNYDITDTYISKNYGSQLLSKRIKIFSTDKRNIEYKIKIIDY